MSSKLKELQRLNNQLDEKINSENQPIFTDMICYIRGADISSYDQELVRRDLSEMVISAQERDEDIYSLIGGDFKEFCDEVIESLPPKTKKNKFFDALDILCSCMAILVPINILFSKDIRRIVEEIFSKRAVNYNIGVSAGMISTTIVIMAAAVLIVNAVMKNALKKPNEAKKYKMVIMGGIFGAGIMALFLLLWKFGNYVLFSVNIFIAIAVAIAFFAVHKLIS